MFDRDGFADRLSWLIYERGFTISSFSKYVGISQPTIVNYTHGRKLPNLEYACMMAEALRVPVDYLATGKERKLNETCKHLLCETP